MKAQGQNTYIVAYSLMGRGRDYTPLYQAIKSYGTWAHITHDVWAVVTNQSATNVRDYLSKFIDANADILFVIKSGYESAWLKVLCRNEWLKENL